MNRKIAACRVQEQPVILWTEFLEKMKTQLLKCIFLWLMASTTPLLAQQKEAKNFEATKAKAQKGDAEAQFQLGVAYDRGQGVAQDSSEAVKWYRKAAEKGFAAAEVNLGVCYEEGNGVGNDGTEAVKWFRSAADQGFAAAEKNLGVCYAQGIGVSRNSTNAVSWLRKAAAQGDANAQYSLGYLILHGDGASMDVAEAAKWFTKAAEQGEALAQIALGACYASGDGVPKDYVKAYKWINLVSSQGNKLANQWLAVLEAKMTSEQVAEAQQLAREFKPHKTPDSNSFTTNKGIFDSSPTASGSGFFITEDGYLISNFHVIKDATQVRLVTSAGLIPAKVVKVDMANDIALLKADGVFSALPVAASSTAGLGDMVFTLGFPDPSLQGFAPKLSKGEIASLSGAADDVRYFQISVPVQPGNSGGALVNEDGNAVGIVSAKLDASAALAASGALPENVNYAIKSSFLLNLLESAPEVSAKLKKPNMSANKFSDAVKSAQSATVLVLVY